MMFQTNSGINLKLKTKERKSSLFEIEHIADPCYVMIATNPKEYIEYFKSQDVNKKHKGIKQSENSMNLEPFTNHITTLSEIESEENKFKEVTVEQSGFTVRKTKWCLIEYRRINLVN